jgi:hypothetical protein
MASKKHCRAISARLCLFRCGRLIASSLAGARRPACCSSSWPFFLAMMANPIVEPRKRHKTAANADTHTARSCAHLWSTWPIRPYFSAKRLISLALPRGLRRASEFNYLAESGTPNRSTQSLGFLAHVSHLGRAAQQLTSEDVAPSDWRLSPLPPVTVSTTQIHPLPNRPAAASALDQLSLRGRFSLCPI